MCGPFGHIVFEWYLVIFRLYWNRMIGWYFPPLLYADPCYFEGTAIQQVETMGSFKHFPGRNYSMSCTVFLVCLSAICCYRRICCHNSHCQIKKSLSLWMFWKALKSNIDEIALWGFEISMCIFADLGFNRKPLFYIYDVVTWQHVKYECPTMIGRRDIDFRNLKLNLLWRCMQLSVGGSTFQYFDKWPK